VECAADSSAPLSRSERKQDAFQAFQAFKGDPHILQYPLYTKVLEQLEGVTVNELLLPEELFNNVERAILKMQQAQAEQAMDKTQPAASTSSGGTEGDQ